MSATDQEDPDDWMNGPRSKKTGRILKGFSGNPGGRPSKPKNETLPFQLAQDILKAGSQEFEVINHKSGRKEKLTGVQAMLKQLVIAGAKGDKSAAKQYMAYINNAARTIEQRTQRLYDRLGAYLKSVDEGRPWRLNQREAAFLQGLADEVGMGVTIRAWEDKPKVEALTAEELDAIVAGANLRHALGDRIVSLNDNDLAEIARRVVYAERRHNLRR